MWYSYSIKFASEPIYEVARTVPSTGCSDNPGNTLLPFKVTNITTDKAVGVYHTDKGTHYKDLGLYSNCTETCSGTQWCNNGTCTEFVGAKDCYWERGENIAFKLGLGDASFLIILGVVFFQLIYILHLSIRISELSDRVQELISTIGIIGKKINLRKRK